MKVLRLDVPTAGSRPFARALETVWDVVKDRATVVVAPPAGGPAALVPFVALVTDLSGDVESTHSNLGRWLEKRQARRSRLLYAADRQSAVAFALRWGLDPTRLRIANGPGVPDGQVARDLAATAKRRPWHST